MWQVMIPFRGKLERFIIKWYLRRRNIRYDNIPSFSGYWPDITNKGDLFIGENCRFNSFRLRQHISVRENARLVVGHNSFFNDGVNICATQSITIGHHAQIGDMTYFYDTDFHEISPEHPTKNAPVSIGNNVWIGAKAIILPGSVIGDHCVIAAGSIVTSEIPAKTLAAGIPAKVIKNIKVPDYWVRE